MKRRKLGNSKLAVGYCRASTDDQRLSEPAQRAALVAWAGREGITIVAWFCDQGVSGSKELDGRAGLGAALAALRSTGAGILAVAKRDRLARDVAIAAAIDKAVGSCGARVISADGAGNGSSPADDLMRVILDGSAAYERALLRQRTVSALQALRARGHRTGGIPFGSSIGEDGKTLINDQGEQQTIAQVLALRAAGLSLRAIADECILVGLKSRSGRPLCKTQVQRILRKAI